MSTRLPYQCLPWSACRRISRASVKILGHHQIPSLFGLSKSIAHFAERVAKFTELRNWNDHRRDVFSEMLNSVPLRRHLGDLNVFVVEDLLLKILFR